MSTVIPNELVYQQPPLVSFWPLDSRVGLADNRHVCRYLSR
jgi:hypothetical protein